jgi:hypothetical protein
MSAAKSPNSLDKGYIITLCVIGGLFFVFPFFSGSSAKPPKISPPSTGTWTMALHDGAELRTTFSVAADSGKWRLELTYPNNPKRPVIVSDGTRVAASESDASPDQLKSLNPIAELQQLCVLFNRHPKPELQQLDGVSCWYINDRTEGTYAELWIDVKTNFPRKITAVKDGRTLTRTYSALSTRLPTDKPLFDPNALSPILGL